MAMMLNAWSISRQVFRFRPRHYGGPTILVNDIRTAILGSADSRGLVFDNISPSVGSAVFDALLEDPDIEDLMPRMTYNSHKSTIIARVLSPTVHGVPQMWLMKELGRMQRTNFLSENEIYHFDSTVGTVADSGWLEDWPNLIAGMKLWLQGGRPYVQLVLLFSWSKRENGSLTGDIHAYERTAAGNVNERFRSTIFPIPEGGPAGIPSDPWRVLWCIWCFPWAERHRRLGPLIDETSRDCVPVDKSQRICAGVRNAGTDEHNSNSFLEAFIVSAFMTSPLPETTFITDLEHPPPT